MLSNNGAISVCESWEKEVLAQHRWKRFPLWFNIADDRGKEEHTRLKKLWEKAQPLDESSKGIMDQIIALEICNWNLEESILALCAAIGKKEPTNLAIGHAPSVSQERWKKVWAYYLILRNWLPCKIKSGYHVLLSVCDPDNTIQNHITEMLGDRSELKKLYVERLSLCLEFWLGGFFPSDSVQMKSHNAAVSVLEKEIKERDPEGQILDGFQLEGDGKLNLCHHKLFRRYDIIISSIGSGRWRAVMPRKGTDGFERAAAVEKYLLPIESWIDVHGRAREYEEDKLLDRIHTLLGKPDEAKLFLASLLVSLLRSQQLAAAKLAENRKKESLICRDAYRCVSDFT